MEAHPWLLLLQCSQTPGLNFQSYNQITLSLQQLRREQHLFCPLDIL